MARRNPAQYANLRAMVWDLRVKGMEVEEISANTNVPTGTIYRWLKDLTAARVEESATDLLALQLRGINARRLVMEQQLAEYLESGKSIARHVEVLNQLDKRQAELLGLDAATKFEATVHEVTATDVAIAELVREANAAAALEEQRIKESN
jgi:transposase